MKKFKDILENYSWVVGKKTAKKMKILSHSPKIISDTDILTLIDLLSQDEGNIERHFIYFWGNKTALSDEDMPKNFLKWQVYHNEPAIYEYFWEQLPKDSYGEFIQPQ